MTTFPVRYPITVRWADVDMYGHMNNAAYYQCFDTAINGWLADAAGVAPTSADVVGVVAESACRFHREVGFGDTVTVGLGVRRLGRSSVTYALGMLVDGDGEERLAASGHWVHVYVSRAGGGACEIPPAVRAALEAARGEFPEFVLGPGSG